MTLRKPLTKTSSRSVYFNELLEQWTPKIVTCSVLLVLFSTLLPFNFSGEESFSIQAIASSFHHRSNFSDLLINILLFLPFGFGFTCLMQKIKLGRIAILATVLTTSAGLSFTVETLQVFLPSRSSSLADVMTNSIGGFIGCVCFYLWKFTIVCYASALIEKTKECLSIKKLTAGLIGYITLSFFISIALQSSTNLSNWNQNFPLLIGNERTGDRPWQGYVSKIFIANRVISDEEVARAFSEQSLFNVSGNSLLAFYQLTGKGSYRDQTGHLPDLSWQGQPSATQDERGVFLNSSHWLTTATPATFMTQKICDTSQFTLSAIVATADTTQTGPARIVSLSGDPYHRNFTLGQEGTNLVFRLRTPLTGEDGSNPELIVPNVFAAPNLHHLIITYYGSVWRLYVDQVQNFYSIELKPELTLFRYVLPTDRGKINLGNFNILVYKILYYGIIFMPLGLILALIATISRGRFIFYVLLICGGILLPSLILESILASGSGRGLRLENLLFSIAITTSTMLLVKMRTASWFPTDRVTQ